MALTAAPIDSVEVTFSSKAAPSSSPATSRAPSRFMSVTATRAPPAASRRQVAAPIPLAPPVTSAVRPSSLMAGQPTRYSRVPLSPSPVPIVGATGALCFGLALRLAHAGVPVVIGSRREESAQEAAEKLRARVPEADVTGMQNADAARSGPLVILSVPFRAQSENLTNLKEVLQAGQILVDATVPLAAAVSGKATRLLGVPQGSAAEQAAEMAPEGVRVLSAFHTVSAALLVDLDVQIDEDVLIAGDDREA